MSGLLKEANGDVHKFHLWLKANKCKGLDEKPSRENNAAVLAIFTIRFSSAMLLRDPDEWTERSEIRADNKNGKSHKNAYERGWDMTRMLLWFVDVIMYHSGDGKYVHLRRAMQYRVGKFDGVMADVDVPMMLLQNGRDYMAKLWPVQTWGVFLRMFGVNRRGRHIDMDLDKQKWRQFPATCKILAVLDDLDLIFKTRIERNDPLSPLESDSSQEKLQASWMEGCYDIDKREASVIALAHFGLGPAYWSSVKNVGHDFYVREKMAVDEIWEQRDGKFIDWEELRDKLRKEKEARTGEYDPDYEEETDYDESDDESPKMPKDGPIQGAVRVGDGGFGVKTRNGKRRKRGKRPWFEADAAMDIYHVCATRLCQQLNSAGANLDTFLDAGWKLREKFGVTACPERPSPPMVAKVMRLGQGGAPSVIHIKNAFSLEFLKKDTEITNATLYCQDQRSDGGTSCIAAFFKCNTCPEIRFMGPLMKVGSHNSVASVPATQWEQLKQGMASELANRSIDPFNQIVDLMLKGGIESHLLDEDAEEETRTNSGDSNGQEDEGFMYCEGLGTNPESNSANDHGHFESRGLGTNKGSSNNKDGDEGDDGDSSVRGNTDDDGSLEGDTAILPVQLRRRPKPSNGIPLRNCSIQHCFWQPDLCRARIHESRTHSVENRQASKKEYHCL